MQKITFGCILSMLLLCSTTARSQAGDPNDTEFRKGSVFLLKINNGVVSSFNKLPDLYEGGLQLNPQVTVAVNSLRLGANAGFVYTAKKFSGLFGPMAALKLKSINLKNLAGLANLQLIAEHNWGTNKQRLFGGGLGLEIFQKAVLSFSVQRDYNLNAWWVQWHTAINLNKNKPKTASFNKKRSPSN